MTESSTTHAVLRPIDRLRAIVAVILVAALLATAGGTILVPLDPQGAVSVLSCRLGWWVIPCCILLAAVLAALVCVLSGAKLEEIGVFSVAVGLALISLRHHNASHLWIQLGQGDDRLRAALASRMMVESLAWFLVILAAYGASTMAIRHFKLIPIAPAPPAAEIKRGLLTTGLVATAGLLAASLLSAGTQLAPIDTGQVCFAYAMGFYLAALLAYQLSGANSSVWAYAGVGLAAIIGYLWTMAHPTPMHPGRPDVAHLAHYPPTAFARALPIQFIMLGTAGAIFGNWHQRQLTRYAVMVENAPASEIAAPPSTSN